MEKLYQYKIMLTSGKVIRVCTRELNIPHLPKKGWVYVFEPDIAIRGKVTREFILSRYNISRDAADYVQGWLIHEAMKKDTCDDCGGAILESDGKFFHEYKLLIPMQYGGDWDAGNIKIVCRNCDDAEKKAIVRRNKLLRKNSQVNKSTKAQVALLHNGKCAICSTINNQKGQMHIDHIIPISRGGGDEIENLQLLCKKCNDTKGSLLPILQNIA